MVSRDDLRLRACCGEKLRLSLEFLHLENARSPEAPALTPLGADLYPYLRLDTGVWVLSAPKGRNNEAQANGLGPRVRRSPILKP